MYLAFGELVGGRTQLAAVCCSPWDEFCLLSAGDDRGEGWLRGHKGLVHLILGCFLLVDEALNVNYFLFSGPIEPALPSSLIYWRQGYGTAMLLAGGGSVTAAFGVYFDLREHRS